MERIACILFTEKENQKINFYYTAFLWEKVANIKLGTENFFYWMRTFYRFSNQYFLNELNSSLKKYAKINNFI